LFPAWIERLPVIVADIEDRWDLTVGAPFIPGGEASWVAPARDRAGRDLVLKIAPTLPENRDEGLGLKLLQPVGAARVYRSEWIGPAVTENDGPDAGTVSILIERIRPGNTLRSLHPEPDHDDVVAEVLRSVWKTNTHDAPLRPLTELTTLWAADFETDVAVIADRIDPDVAREGVTMFRTLASQSDDCTLLFTDLHAENILSGPSGWRLVDPKPYVGDRCYDVLQHLFNCRRFENAPLTLIRRMANLTSVDSERLLCWAFARAVIESAWDPRWISTAHRLHSALAP
jgi:streptomycin 6-kinase